MGDKLWQPEDDPIAQARRAFSIASEYNGVPRGIDERYWRAVHKMVGLVPILCDEIESHRQSTEPTKHEVGRSKISSTERLETINHKFQSGSTLDNLEIEQVLTTALWAMGEMEHILNSEPELYPEVGEPGH
jgi:hypothetical protein